MCDQGTDVQRMRRRLTVCITVFAAISLFGGEVRGNLRATHQTLEVRMQNVFQLVVRAHNACTCMRDGAPLSYHAATPQPQNTGARATGEWGPAYDQGWTAATKQLILVEAINHGTDSPTFAILVFVGTHPCALCDSHQTNRVHEQSGIWRPHE